MPPEGSSGQRSEGAPALRHSAFPLLPPDALLTSPKAVPTVPSRQSSKARGPERQTRTIPGPACWGHGFPCSSQPPGHPRPRGGSTVCPGCFPSRQNTLHRQGQAPRTQRPRRAPITQAGPGLDQRADADPSGRENEPQWGQLVGSTKAPRCLIFRSRVHVSEGQDKKGGFILTQSL